ncbi:MAG: c-type cytochrome [Candidatus Marinarcus sp.]|uniref:c-type cytochrome n=1 Tax=Candidatus Marinarcus sp. TaxID=3100987 RepID=UPI003AFFF82C
MKILIFSTIVAAFLLTGCNDDKKTSSTTTVETVKPQAAQSIDEATVVTEAKEEAKVALNDVKDEVAVVDEKVNKAVEEKVEEAKVAVTQSQPTVGETLYKKTCSGCHGVTAEKKALGVSQVIQGWDKEKTVAALHGYKDNTYGAGMKNIMFGQVSSLDEESINSVAEYIATLK